MKIEIKCDQCGKKFCRTERRIALNKRYNFCSRECRDKHFRKNGFEGKKYNKSAYKKIVKIAKRMD